MARSVLDGLISGDNCTQRPDVSKYVRSVSNGFLQAFVACLVIFPGEGVLPYKGLMGTCGQPGYVFRDFCLKQGIDFIIFCLNHGIDFINICLKQGIFSWTIKSPRVCSTN